MKITLKGLKSFQGMDGQAFRAQICFDGKVVGSVVNEGMGGPNNYVGLTSYGLSKKDTATLKAAANAAGHKGIECEDMFIEDLIEEMDVLKEHKKNLKKGFKVTAWVDLGPFERATIHLFSKDNLEKHLKKNKAKLIKLFEGEEALVSSS